MRLNDTLSVTPDGWQLLEQGWSADRAVAVGSNFLVGNGYLGYRGTSPEQLATDFVGLTVSDTYDCADGHWRELCTVPNPLLVAATAHGQALSVAFAQEVETSLDLRTGTFGARFVQRLLPAGAPGDDAGGDWPGAGAGAVAAEARGDARGGGDDGPGDGGSEGDTASAAGGPAPGGPAEGAAGGHGAGEGDPEPAPGTGAGPVATPSGPLLEVTCRRVASAVDRHVLAQRWELTTDQPVELELAEGIDGVVWSLNGDHFAQLDVVSRDDQLVATGVTGDSGVRIVVVQQATVSSGVALTESDDDARAADDPLASRRRVRRHRVRLEPGTPLVVESHAAVVTSNDVADPAAAASDAVTAAAAAGFDAVSAASAERWAELWTTMDIEIGGPTVDQTALRFCTYHNWICTPAHTDHLPVGARGLSCQAYQGAAFWDQEIYNLPALLFTAPDVARQLLVYRHKTLDGARRKARRLGYTGAFYAWISGDTGDELCPDVFFRDVLTGRPIRNHFNDWQIHVAPDIVTTIARYVEVTGDETFLVEHGAEIAFEVARFLRSFVRYDEWRGTYHCIRLLGPDEWHENVDDNAFTNHQVRAALAFAVDTHERLAAHRPDELAALADRLGLGSTEVEAWGRIRDQLALPQPDPETGLVEQFRGFFALEDTTPEVVRSRLIDPQEYWGWPNGVAVATQVSKQADVVVLMWQHHREFSEAVQRANYAYYEPRCAHFSTLSHAPHGIVAARVGELDAALRHFRATATIDLLTTAHSVVGGTFIGGIHTAACGGAYQLVQLGFGGLDVVDGTLRIDPVLPAEWESLTYPVAWRGGRLRVDVDQDALTVAQETPGADPVELVLRGRTVTVAPGAPVRVPLTGGAPTTGQET